MSKVFITGANGMLGSHICRELIKQGYEVKAMCLPNSDMTTINKLPIECVFGDILDKPFIIKNMNGCDFVIHVAAIASVWPRRNPFMKKVNIQGTKYVMEAAEELGIKRMVNIGSASSFEHGSKKHPGTESNRYDGWQLGMDYLDSKFLAQQILLEQHAKTGFPVVIINPTFMIGAFDTGPSSGQILINYFKGNLPGYSGGGKNFVCALDVACATVNALKKGKIGQCYIAGNENLSYKEFLNKAANAMNKTFSLKRIPMVVVLAVGVYSSILARITNKKPKISYGIAKFSGIDQYYSAEKARCALEMPQTPIELGIKDAMQWFNENSYL